MTANSILKTVEVWLGDAREQSDGKLLERFLGGERDALETLVRRHASMVWGVCRRNLAQLDLAHSEDAFQATFVVLLRKAASIRPPDRLANWLYGVAYQTARKVKQTAVKRGIREKPLTELPEPHVKSPNDTYPSESRARLDEALSRLPEKYRMPLVLCQLEGRSLRDVAQQLQVPEGTVGSRLARGKKMLAHRLTRHGVTMSAASVAALLTEQAMSAVAPEALRNRTIQSIGPLVAGQLADGLLSAGASALADGVLQSLTVTKKKTVAVCLLLAAFVLASGAAAYFSLARQETKPVEPREQAAPPPEDQEKPDPDKLAERPKQNPIEPVPDRDGTAAGATNAARSLLQKHLFTLTVWGRSPNNPGAPAPYHGGKFGYWPSRDVEATFDPETRHWILTGSCRHDVSPGMLTIDKNEPYNAKFTKGWDPREREWKLVLAYNQSAKAYEVQKADLPPDTSFYWRPTSKDDFARWLLGEFPEAKPSSDPVTLLILDVAVPEPAKLSLKPNYTYGKKDLTVETTPRGVNVRVDYGAGVHTDQWNLQFGGPDTQFLKVAKYGGAYSQEAIVGSLMSPGPLIAVKQSVLDRGKKTSEWICDPGEFVVREIEVKEKKVARLAIDFIADTEYGHPAAAKRDTRRVIRGSLRFNSLLQPSVPNLAGDAAEYRLSAPAPAGLRGMKFVPLRKGTFYMGWDGTKGSARKTEIKGDFEIAVYTVTQGQWQELMWNNPSWFSRHGGGKEAVKDVTDEDLKLFPVESVSQNDILEFIKKLNEREKGKGYVYRLPTQEEWEYACRGGATTEEECSYHFYVAKPTNDLSSKQANFNGNQPFGTSEKGPYLGRTTKVGSYAPNALGLYDMHGNVWQRPSTPGGHRGGSWNNSGETCRAISRATTRNTCPESLGFRLVRVRER